MNFEENFSELGVRFNEYLKYKGLKGKEVSETSSYSPSQISNIIKGKVFGCDKIFNILNIYNDLNANWLFTGNGSMIKKGSKEYLNIEKNTFKDDLNSTDVELLQKDLETAKATLESQKDMIDLQKDFINKLKEDIQRLNTEIELLKGKE